MRQGGEFIAARVYECVRRRVWSIGSMSRRWQRNDQVLRVAREHMWPAGAHHLGVHWASGLDLNKAELDRRIARGEFSAAQCLSRLTDGMPNYHGPPNGPQRPTLATKWRLHGVGGASPDDIDQHVAALREHVATQVAQHLGLLTSHARAMPIDSATSSAKRKAADAVDAHRDDECLAPPAAKQPRAETSSVWRCGLRISGQPGDAAPSLPGGVLSKQIFVAKSKSVRQNQQEQLARIKLGELSITYALLCMRVGGPLRRHWGAASDPAVERHIDELCTFLSELRKRAEEGTRNGSV